MRILVDNSSYDLLNFGDDAMLRVGVDRLLALWPEATIEVFTFAPDRLAVLCPKVRPLVPDGRLLWLQDRNLFGGLHQLFPQRIRPWLDQFESDMRVRFARKSRTRIARRLQRRGVSLASFDYFLDALAGADLLLLTGGGYLTDAFPQVADRVLETTRLATRLGVPVAMMGQGLGPLVSPILQKKFQQSMAGTILLALREDRQATPLLRSMNVPLDRVVTTGDDAIELAYRDDASAGPLGKGIGVNLRLSDYSTLDESTVSTVRAAIQRLHKAQRAELVPVPISRYEKESDARSIRAILKGIDDNSDGGASITSVEEICQQIARCRVILTGSYHAGVFALSQGIPAVCILKSSYYRGKFEGLAALFGRGCFVVSSDRPDFAGQLQQALDDAWASARELKPGLLEAARSQRDSGRAAYAALKDRLASRASAG